MKMNKSSKMGGPGHSHKSHINPGTKLGKSTPQGSGLGSNLNLPTPSQAIHVMKKKDTMAQNVSNHMGTKAAMGPKQPMTMSGGKSAKKVKSM